MTSFGCSCSTCTCSESSDDCLTLMFVTLYENSRWCIQMIYELFFQSLWQVLLYVKDEWQDSQTNVVLHRQIRTRSRPRRKETSSIVVISVRSTDCQTEEVIRETVDVACNRSERSWNLDQPLIFTKGDISHRPNESSFLPGKKNVCAVVDHSEKKSLPQAITQETNIIDSPVQLRRKSKQKQRIDIPLVLSTSLHSHGDYLLAEYLHQLLPSKHCGK